MALTSLGRRGGGAIPSSRAAAGESWIDPAHDAAGNMTLAARPGDEADANDGLLLVYDAWNRLTEVYDDNDADGQGDAGELLVTYEYDGQRRLVAKTVEGDPDVVYDNYYNADWQLLELCRADDADPQDHYVWDLRYIDAPVVRLHDGNTDGDYDDAEDNVLYYTSDAKFNVTAVIDASGNVVERYAYDPYGAVTVLDGTTGGQTDWATDADQVSDVANEILYSGYRYDAETGLYIVRNRIYHPTLGRFLQRDPLGYVDGMSLCQYLQSAPIGGADPSGRQNPGPEPYALIRQQHLKAKADVMRKLLAVHDAHAGRLYYEDGGVTGLYNLVWNRLIPGLHENPAGRFGYFLQRPGGDPEDPLYTVARHRKGHIQINTDPATQRFARRPESWVFHEAVHWYLWSRRWFQRSNRAEGRRNEGIAYAAQSMEQALRNFRHVENALVQGAWGPLQTVMSWARVQMSWARAWENMGRVLTVRGYYSWKQEQPLWVHLLTDVPSGEVVFTVSPQDVTNVGRYLDFRISCRAIAQKYNDHPVARLACWRFVCDPATPPRPGFLNIVPLARVPDAFLGR